jgi:hypothetical protein
LKGISVIACTFLNAGSYGILSCVEQWRHTHLQSLGFYGSWQDKVFGFEFERIKPVFYKGILVTDLSSKGTALSGFLDAINLNFYKIIMFYDSRDYLISVEEVCKKTTKAKSENNEISKLLEDKNIFF